MKPITLIFITFAFIAFALIPASVAQAQTSPCAAALPPISLISASSKVVADFSDYTAQIGAWTDTDIYIFPSGTSPLTGVQAGSITVAKANWTLQPSTSTCYGTPGPAFLLGVQPNTTYDLYVRTKRASDSAISSWAGPVPFARQGPLVAPTGIRITQ